MWLPNAPPAKGLFLCCGILFVGRCSVACSCVVPTPPACQEAWRAAVVFAGTVVQTETIRDEQQFPLVEVHLTVTEPFVGITSETKQIEIRTPSGGSACGFYFEREHTYLVYAERMPNGILRTTHCMRTASLDKASADLAYLRGLSTRRPVGEITGIAYDSQIPSPVGGAEWPWGGLPGVRVTIRSDNFQKSAVTDSNGRFAFSELPPDNYSVTAASSGYWAGNPVKALVPAKGCADIDLDLNVDRVIAGSLFDQFGKTVPNVTVELVGSERGFGYVDTKSDAQGHYEFRRLPTGEYYLGVSLTGQPFADHPFQRWYYPGVSDFTKALSLSIGPEPKLVNVDLPLPEPRKEVAINGIVLWPDGRPAADVGVFPEHPDFQSQLGMIRFSTDENGKFQGKLFDKTTYKLYAVKYEASGHKATSAEPVTIIPDQLKEGTIVRLVLSHDGDLVTAEMNRR